MLKWSLGKKLRLPVVHAVDPGKIALQSLLTVLSHQWGRRINAEGWLVSLRHVLVGEAGAGHLQRDTLAERGQSDESALQMGTRCVRSSNGWFRQPDLEVPNRKCLITLSVPKRLER